PARDAAPHAVEARLTGLAGAGRAPIGDEAVGALAVGGRPARRAVAQRARALRVHRDTAADRLEGVRRLAAERDVLAALLDLLGAADAGQHLADRAAHHRKVEDLDGAAVVREVEVRVGDVEGRTPGGGDQAGRVVEPLVRGG